MAKTYSAVLVGVDIHIIEIETVVGSGFSGLNILGLTGDALRDMRERVRSALESAGICLPARRIVVSLTPTQSLRLCRTPLAELDFAVAASIVRAIDCEKNNNVMTLKNEFFLGELALSGDLRPLSRDLLSDSLLSQLGGTDKYCLCIPSKNISESSSYKSFMSFTKWFEERDSININNKVPSLALDLINNNFSNKAQRYEYLQKACADFKNNPKLLLALLVAAAGKHNFLLAGEPGVGKTYAMQALSHLLPPLSNAEMLEQQRIYDGLSATTFLRPFRTPHHTTTSAALIGGASLRPGEITLANNGVLFLDELAEFSRASLESLREPLDAGVVSINRSAGVISYPARFQLCAATNPCPCGFLLSRKKPCRCNPTSVQKYLQKLSGPLLDRFCIQLVVSPDTNSENLNNLTNALNECIWGSQAMQMQFFDNFITVQNNIWESFNYSSAHPYIAKLEHELGAMPFSLSLRGTAKIARLANTFLALFPKVKKSAELWHEFFLFRNLEAVLSKNLY